MRARGLTRLSALAAAIVLLVGSAAVVRAQSREQSRGDIAYWRTRYQELKPTNDPRVARAHGIFQRVVQVAGKRPGVVPRLFIAARDPWDIALPIALPDGWIILSKGVLDICYQEAARGDDRLAFVVAHEIAHQLNDDFWHMRFFQALEASQARAQVPPEFLEELRRTSRTPEHVLARELQADERGIIYAAIAGFTPSAIIAEGPGVNFFADWVRALDPERIRGVATGPLRPTPQERADALRAHLRRVANTTALFQVGLWFSYAGDYPQAIQAFEAFRAFFPGREVLHNLAASHHRLALHAYQVWQQARPTFPFQLSLALDPLTRASRIYLEGPTRGGAAGAAALATEVRQHLDQAIALYQEALAHDAAYTPAAVNLGCALLVRGLTAAKPGLNADLAEALTTLLRALELHPTSPEILNNLGVAWFYMERTDRAKALLTQAQTLAPAYAAPVFNLGQIAHTEHRDADAQHYWQASEALAPRPPPGPPTAHLGTERVLGLGVGQLTEHVPPAWDTPTRSQVQVERRTLAVATYPAGVMTLTQDGEIRMLMARDDFRGASTQGIRIGSAAQDVLASYGAPTRRVELTQGQSWAYDAHRIAFQLRDGRVVSWLLF